MEEAAWSNHLPHWLLSSVPLGWLPRELSFEDLGDRGTGAETLFSEDLSGVLYNPPCGVTVTQMCPRQATPLLPLHTIEQKQRGLAEDSVLFKQLAIITCFQQKL